MAGEAGVLRPLDPLAFDYFFLRLRDSTLCREVKLNSGVVLGCSDAFLEASEKTCLGFKSHSSRISRMLISASCSISYSEYDVSGSLGFKA